MCACTPVTVCVSCRDHSVSAASLISEHHGTCLNSKRGLERTSCPPGESLRLPSTHSGHSSYHTLLNYTMSNPPVGLKNTEAPLLIGTECVCCAYFGVCIFVSVHAWRVIEGERRILDSFSQYVGHTECAWFLQEEKGKTVPPRLYHKYLFPLNNA